MGIERGRLREEELAEMMRMGCDVSRPQKMGGAFAPRCQTRGNDQRNWVNSGEEER
jgi:hypothetical protein